MDKPKPATYVPADAGSFRYVEKSNPQTSNLQFLTYGVYELAGPIRSGALAHPGEETLLFGWQGKATVSLAGKDYALETYDALYLPRDAAYRLSLDGGESRIVVCRAPAEKAHPV